MLQSISIFNDTNNLNKLLMEPVKNYNRVVLIGNGFDKALGLATSYSDFMRYFVIERLKESIYQKPAKSDLLSLVFNGEMNDNKRNKIESTLSESSLSDLLKFLKKDTTQSHKYGFISDLMEHFNELNWIDIEQLYFRSLKYEFYKIKGENNTQNSYTPIIELNKCMDALTVELDNYIYNQQKSFNTNFYNSPMASFIDRFKDHMNFSSITMESLHQKETKPEKVLYLNFNYTNTLNRFLSVNFDRSRFLHVYIHGEVKNKQNEIIFGYGDDTSDQYKQLELEGNNELLRLIKSFQYPKTDNYHKFLSFIGSNNFEVFVVGHSCGLSDRTLLKTIFEHDNCLSIKTFHYKGEEEDFHKRIEISRHFSDKQKMREILLPYDQNATIPQTSKST